MNEADVLALRITLSDRYKLLRPIATGGMAEIFLARQKALAGFEKDVAVKLLQDRYLRDPRIVEMFMNEAKIGASLAHPNIVHFYELGEHDKQPFIAMEFIHGEELSQLCRRGLELARFLPLEHAVDLVRQAAEAMGYFHAKRGEGGQPLEIVHRDISPSNLLITQDGVLKVIDFGIARASFPGEPGAEGADKLVPGKYNYMSPEQVRGERVDHRSDIFSLGIVLYEITVGKRLFKGRPEEVMGKITRGRIKPPTFIRRQFPPALERIVMRALETHRDDRYASAYELANDLEEFLRDSGLKSGPVRIAQYLDELRVAEGADRRPELIIAGEAWLDDDGEEALDFERGFSLGAPRGTPVSRAAQPAPAKEEKAAAAAAPAPAAPTSAPVPLVAPPSAPVPLAEAAPVAMPVEKVEKAEVAAPPAAAAAESSAPTVVDDEDVLTNVGSAVVQAIASETAPLRTAPRAGDEELTNVQGLREAAMDPDLGEDTPTDANLMLPDGVVAAEADDDGAGPLTTPILLVEPTGQVPLTARTSKVPLAPIPMPGQGKAPAAQPKRAIPLRAEPTGRVTKMAPPPAEPPARAPLPPSLLSPAGRAAAEAARLAALDPSAALDTPLPPVPDPMSFDDTARHPLAEPMLDGFMQASGIKLLRAEVPAARPAAPPTVEVDDMAKTTDLGTAESLADPGPPAPQRQARGNGKKKAKARPRYRPSSRINLELTPDAAASPVFGAGVIATRRRSNIPWPMIIGALLAATLLILLMTR